MAPHKSNSFPNVEPGSRHRRKKAKEDPPHHPLAKPPQSRRRKLARTRIILKNNWYESLEQASLTYCLDAIGATLGLARRSLHDSRSRWASCWEK